MDVYGERNPGRIKAILQAQLKERKRRSKRERHKGSLKNWSRPKFSAGDFIFSLGFRFPQPGPVCGPGDQPACAAL